MLLFHFCFCFLGFALFMYDLMSRLHLAIIDINPISQHFNVSKRVKVHGPFDIHLNKIYFKKIYEKCLGKLIMFQDK